MAMLIPGASACSLVSTDSPFWATLTAYVTETTRMPVTRDYVNSVPFASIIAQYEGAAAAFLVLANIDGEHQYWRAANGATLVTRGCYLVKTAGLATDIQNVTFTQPPLSPAEMPGRRLERLVDAPAAGKMTYGMKIVSTFETAGEQDINILGVVHHVRVTNERIQREDGEYVTNTYYTDPASRNCVQSEQQIISGQQRLLIRLTRPWIQN